MSEPVVRLERLSKQYRIGRTDAYRTLRETLVEAFRAPFSWTWGEGQGPKEETVWALREVDLEVGPGEVLGLVGRNGAGKSTLLKILSRITEPTEGRAWTRGRVASLLEIGTGFHPELTGRENVLLSGALLGMGRHEVRQKLDQIVAFSGVDRFVDTPVKRYSSGMYLRLAFAVAAHLETEILLVDEILAVGDIAFQKRCLGRMRDVAQEGRTILFVSHNLSAVGNLCTSAALLHEGRLVERGEVARVLSLYRGEVTGASGAARTGSAALRVLSVELDGEQEEPGVFAPFSSCIVRIAFETGELIDPLEVNVVVQDADARTCIHLRSDFDDEHPAFPPGRHRAEVRIAALHLEGQLYFLRIRLVSRRPVVVADSESIPLEVRAPWDRHEEMRPVVAVERRWTWLPGPSPR